MAAWLGHHGGVAAQWSDSVSIAEEKAEPPLRHHSLELSQFAPKSMLQVHESHVPRSKFPLIDFHTHIRTRPNRCAECRSHPHERIRPRQKSFWKSWIERTFAPW